MAVDVSQETNLINTAINGKDVRGSLANGITKIADELNSFEGNIDNRQTSVETRQANLESTFSQEIENAVSENPSSAETVGARTDNVNNVTYGTLGARLDNQASQMAENITQLDTLSTNKADKTIVDLRDFVRYGDIDLFESAGFKHNINFRLYRDKDGKINHNFNVDALVSGWLTIYVAGLLGADINDGLTDTTQLATLQKAFEIAEARPETNIIIKITVPILTRTRSALQISTNNQILTKNYAIISDTESFIGSIEPQLTWSANGTCYQASRTGVAYVYDKKNKNWDGSATRYKKVNSIAECQATKGSWFTDGAIVYVRRLDDLAVDTDILVVLLSGVFRFQQTGDIKFIAKNINFMGCDSLNSNFRIMNPSNTGQVIMDNCRFLGSAYDNAYTFLNIKYSWLFNCIANSAFRDGFNYHNTTANKGVDSFIFEYNCISYDNGLIDTNANNNAFTAHDGLNILRINCIGFNTGGPILADVNGCYSVNYDCVMYDSARPVSGDTKSAFWFDDETPVRHGKTWLINCSGGGVDTYGINSDGINEVYIKNFIGRNIPSGQLITFLD